MVILDEVGNEARTNREFVSGCFNDILRQRSNLLLPTIMTSNLEFNKIKSFYGDEVYSILHESTMQLEFKGVDFRQGITKVK